jgi:hypothetical protein
MWILLDKYKVYLVVFLVGLIAALLVAWQMWKPEPPVVQTAAAQAVQKDGSVVAEKVPDAAAKPAAIVPKGSTLTRIVKVSLKAKLPTVELSGGVSVETRVEQLQDMAKSGAPPEMIEQVKQEIIAAVKECPAINLELDLVTDKDGQQRAVLISDGEIISTKDIPTVNVAPAKAYNWGLGASYDPWKETVGVIVERRLHNILPVTVGAEIQQSAAGSLNNLGARAFAMWNF